MHNSLLLPKNVLKIAWLKHASRISDYTSGLHHPGSTSDSIPNGFAYSSSSSEVEKPPPSNIAK